MIHLAPCRNRRDPEIFKALFEEILYRIMTAAPEYGCPGKILSIAITIVTRKISATSRFIPFF
jgi:hypothetical protein